MLRIGSGPFIKFFDSLLLDYFIDIRYHRSFLPKKMHDITKDANKIGKITTKFLYHRDLIALLFGLIFLTIWLSSFSNRNEDGFNLKTSEFLLSYAFLSIIMTLSRGLKHTADRAVEFARNHLFFKAPHVRNEVQQYGHSMARQYV